MSDIDIAEFIKSTFDAAGAVVAQAQDPHDITVTFDFTLTSNQGNGIVSYSEGKLQFAPGHIIETKTSRFFVPPQFFISGSAPYYFSDRRTPQNGPFDEQSGSVDRIRLFIVGSLSTGRFGPVEAPIAITIELESHGKVHINFQADCLAGVLFGVGSPAAGKGSKDALYLISLSNMVAAVPPR